MKELGLVILCYLIGSIPFSYIFSRFFGGVDIRSKGTGNVGATNVLRTVGKKVAAAALLGDFLKGFLAAWIGYTMGGTTVAAICAVIAVVGHCWPIFLGFKGGKGVATSAGLILFLMPSVFPILVLVFVGLIALTRYVSLGSISAAIIFPFLVFITHQPWPYIIMSLILSIMVLIRHSGNIDRLRKGNERRINEKVTGLEGK